MPTAQLPCATKLLESPRCWCLRAGKWWSNSSATVRRTPSRRPSNGTLDKKLLAVCKSKRPGFDLGVYFFCLKVSYDFWPSLALRESRVFFPHCCSQLWFLQSFYPALVPQMMGSKVCALDWGNKILFLLLRGFYHGDKLKCDSAGHARGQSPFRRLDGRWGRARTSINVSEINVSDRRLTIHADRLTLIHDGHALAFQTSGNKKPKRTSRLRIETEPGAGAALPRKGRRCSREYS